MHDIFSDYFDLLKNMFFVEENDLKVLMFVMRCHEIWFGATMHNLNAKEWIDSAPNPLIDEETEAVVEDTEVMNDACATKPTAVSYTHLRAHRDATLSRMPSSA